MKFFHKPLTRNMIWDLKKAREIELSQAPGNICFFYNFYGTLSGLHQRHLVETKNIILNGREILSVCITEAGINLLKQQEEYENNLEIQPKWNSTFNKIYVIKPLWRKIRLLMLFIKVKYGIF